MLSSFFSLRLTAFSEAFFDFRQVYLLDKVKEARETACQAPLSLAFLGFGGFLRDGYTHF